MDYCETNQGTRIRLCLAYEEIQMPAIDELCNKYLEWLELSKDLKGGRTTRSANKKADIVYEEIMNFKLPPIKLQTQTSPTLKNAAQPSSVRSSTNTSEAYSSIDSDSDTSSSRPVTRSLRSRSRTPTVQNNNTNNNNNNRQPSRPVTSPSTPVAHHKIRAYMKKPPPSGSSDGGAGSSVLSAALNQQHPSVSVTKIRQLLRADSAQKKRDEEKERQERLMLDRKNKEDRAEAQKKQILEERAVSAKMKREQRLQHAAEVRKAREEAREAAKQAQKMKEAEAKKAALAHPIPEANHKGHGATTAHAPASTTTTSTTTTSATVVSTPTLNAISISCSTTTMHHNQQPINESTKDKPSKHNKHQEPKLKATAVPTKTASPPPASKEMQQNKQLNGTFRKPSGDANNIDISCQDESTNETHEKVPTTAIWARAPHFREFLIKQFSKPESERHKEVLSIFPRVELPIDLEQIFGSNKAVSTRYMCRTSSAVWNSPRRPSMKRTSSMVLTPNNNEKH